MRNPGAALVGPLLGLCLIGCVAGTEPPAPSAPLARATDAATEPARLTPVDTAPSGTPLPAAITTPTLAPSSSPTAAPSGTPTMAPIAAPTLSPTPITAAGFRQDTGFPPVAVERLWAAPDGQPWALTAAGAYRLAEDGWAQIWAGPVTPLGADASGRAWAWLDGQATLATYGATTGWQPLGPGRPEGTDTSGDPVTGFVVDARGNAWIARGRDGLWQFDMETGAWTIWRGDDVGFSPPPVSEDSFAAYAPELYFTAVAVDRLDGVWVAACPLLIYEDGPIPWQIRDGEGARRFDGEAWHGIDVAADRCLWDIAVDGEGGVWLAGPRNDLWTGANDFLRYGVETGWEQLPVPANEALFGDRPRFVSQVRFDRAGNPWLWVETRGGAHFPAPGLYTSLGGDWITVMDEFLGTVAFGPDGNAWLFGVEAYLSQAGRLDRELLWYRQMVGEVVPLDADRVRPESMVVDGEDRVWFVGADGQSLWVAFAPPSVLRR